MSLGLSIILVSLGLIVVSYLIGSVNFAIIFTNHYAHTDVREHGSGNAGMTNVLRTAGKTPAILTFLCDFAKGAVAVSIGKYLAYSILQVITQTDVTTQINPLYFAYLGGFFCLFGHIYPLFFSFKGGKGVASLAGIMLVIDWRVMLIGISVFIIMVLITKIVSISSVLASATLPITTYFLYSTDVDYSFTLLGLSQKFCITVFAALFTVIILIKHSSNMKRLVKGEEKKLNFKKK